MESLPLNLCTDYVPWTSVGTAAYWHRGRALYGVPAAHKRGACPFPHPASHCYHGRMFIVCSHEVQFSREEGGPGWVWRYLLSTPDVSVQVEVVSSWIIASCPGWTYAHGILDSSVITESKNP